jgi:protein SCO1/2
MFNRERKYFVNLFKIAACATLLAVVGGCNRPAIVESYTPINKTDCLPSIVLTDQHDKPVVLSSFKGKPVLVNFIYTSCPGPCLTETQHMAKVADRISKELGSKVVMLTITVDPEHDGPRQLLAYTRSQDAERPGWYFLTGAPGTIDKVLSNFKLIRQREADGSVMHIVGVFLLGPDGRVVREYNGEILQAGTVTADINREMAKAKA